MATVKSQTQSATVGQQQLVDALGVMAFAVMAALNKLASENELSLTQLRMLGILRDRQLKISELAYALGLDRSSVSGLVDRTEQKGLIQKQPDPLDGRSVLVTVSRKGAHAAERGAAETARLLAPMTDALNRVETQRLTVLLERMLQHRWLPPEQTQQR